MANKYDIRLLKRKRNLTFISEMMLYQYIIHVIGTICLKCALKKLKQSDPIWNIVENVKLHH